MDGVATDYLEGQIGGHLFGDTTWAKPTTLYVGLLVAVTDGETASVAEASGGGYDRVQNDPGTANWTNIAASQWANAVKLTFPAPSGGDWGQVVGVGVWDADLATGGNLLTYILLDASQTLNDGDPAPYFGVGDLVFDFD